MTAPGSNGATGLVVKLRLTNTGAERRTGKTCNIWKCLHKRPYAKFCGLVSAGIALIAVGLPLYVLSAKAVMRAFSANQLVTDGVYRICRHPLYGAWIVFIAPGIELLFGTWPGLTTPVAMYVLLRVLARKEEDYLSAHTC